MRVLVIGAGAFGLATALELSRRGADVRVLEAARIGAGASGGVVGALAPHGPEAWRPLKAFQFAALAGMADWVARLEAESGLATGYARTGRLAALARPGQRARATDSIAAAPDHWGADWRMEMLDEVPADLTGWVDGAGLHGLARDTLSARIDPAAYLRAMAAALGSVTEACPGQRVVPGAVETADGTIEADAVVIAAGWQSAALLDGSYGGAPVKGQAALLGAPADPGWPLLTGDGLYIVPHGPGRVAVGSTSERTFDGEGCDGQLDDLIARAAALSPALRGAPVLRRWSGLRPKSPGRDPLVGEVPGAPGVWLATGGYGIGLGIAHRVGEALAARITGTPGPDLPEDFDPAGWLA